MTAATERLLKLRILVAFLGEKHASGWWDTSFLDKNGREYLAFAFPRTATAAAVRAAAEAAKRIHDERIGVGRVFHLFRLPFELEQDLHGAIDELGAKGVIELIEDADTAQLLLDEMAGGEIRAENGTSTSGPISAGKISTISTTETAKRIAQYYLGAVQSGEAVYPYLEAE
jgi:hypothetical protein